MATKKEESEYFAQQGHDQAFGPVCRYKLGESRICNTAEELKEADADGWKDTPQPKPKPKPETASQLKAKPK